MATDGIKFNDFDYSSKYKQIGGEDAKTDEINYSDGLTKSEAQRINEKYGKNDGTITEDEFVEACLNDEEETSDIKSKSKDDIESIFKNYLSGFSNANKKDSSSSTTETKNDEVKPSVELQSGSKLPSSLKFGPSISISNIKSGDKEGEFYNSMEMDGKTYKRSEANKNHNGMEKYVLIPEPEDGSKIVIEKHANGTQHFAVYGTDKKAKSQLELDKEGNAKSIFRFDEKTGLAYEREYFDSSNVLRRYERDENNTLISSMDYIKKDDGTIDEKRPYSKQTYVDVEEMGKQWASRVIFEYDDDDKQSVKETRKYDWNQEKNDDGELTGKITKTINIYKGDSTNEEDLISQYIEELMEGLVTSSEENEKDKKTTKVKHNSDGSSTTIITEGDKKTVIEKDKDGNITSKKVTENGITKTTTYKDGEEDETSECNMNTEGYSDEVQGILSKLKTDKLPEDVTSVISLVSHTMKNGDEVTKDSKADEVKDKKDEDEKDKAEEESSKTATTRESGSAVTYRTGTQKYSDRTNTYTEIFEGDKADGKQKGGYGVIQYNNGEYEIHYDTFKDEKIDTSKGVIINEKDETITYYTKGDDGKTKKVVYKFDGTEVK